jgi:hypothetical protein
MTKGLTCSHNFPSNWVELLEDGIILCTLFADDPFYITCTGINTFSTLVTKWPYFTAHCFKGTT